jgi:hypothetical protein
MAQVTAQGSPQKHFSLVLKSEADRQNAQTNNGGNHNVESPQSPKSDSDPEENGEQGKTKLVDNRFALFVSEKLHQQEPLPPTKQDFGKAYAALVSTLTPADHALNGKALAPMQCLWQLSKLGHVKVAKDGTVTWLSPQPGAGRWVPVLYSPEDAPTADKKKPDGRRGSEPQMQRSMRSGGSSSPPPAGSKTPSGRIMTPSSSTPPFLGLSPKRTPRGLQLGAPAQTVLHSIRAGIPAARERNYEAARLLMQPILGDEDANKYAALLADNEVDWETLHLMSKQDLAEIGFTMGARVKLHAACAGAVSAAGGNVPQPPAVAQEERRSGEPEPAQLKPQQQQVMSTLASLGVREIVTGIIGACDSGQMPIPALYKDFQQKTGVHLSTAIEVLGFETIDHFLRSIPGLNTSGYSVKLTNGRSKLSKSNTGNWRRDSNEEGNNATSSPRSSPIRSTLSVKASPFLPPVTPSKSLPVESLGGKSDAPQPA